MEIRSEYDDGRCRIFLEGEMTIYAVHQIKEALMGAVEHDREVDIDLAAITEIDSAGIQLLVLAKREAAAREKRLSLVEHSPAAVEAIELLNLSGYFGDPLVIPGVRGVERGGD